MSLNLTCRPILIVGGGEIAFRKVSLLLRVGAVIKIVARHLCNDLHILHINKKIYWISKTFHKDQLRKIFLVIVATNDAILNKYIFKKANDRYLLVNVVDDKPKCSIIFPSIINRSPIMISISSEGCAPILCCILREKIESMLPKKFGDIATFAGKWRNKISQHFNNIVIQRMFWRKLFNSIFVNQVLNGNTNCAKKTLQKYMEQKYLSRGEVILVGAGPGDKDLLTLKGLHALQEADVILYDALINNDILDFARRDARLIYVGKCAGSKCIQQKQINNMLIDLAKSGNKVIRLKGGDGFIFGRGGEELEVLQQSGITFQVIPGITAAIGISAYTGIPLTHRLYSSGVTFLTGSSIKNNFLDWSILSYSHNTIVVYMSKIQVQNIYDQFLLHGKSLCTPIAFVEHGTTIKQKVLIGTLNDIINFSKQISNPALLIIGNVVNLHKTLMWFNSNNINVS